MKWTPRLGLKLYHDFLSNRLSNQSSGNKTFNKLLGQKTAKITPETLGNCNINADIANRHSRLAKESGKEAIKNAGASSLAYQEKQEKIEATKPYLDGS